MAVKVKVKSKDLGLTKLLDAARLLKRGDVSVGVFGEAGGDIVLRASVHEFGAPSRNIPARSFLRATMDAKRSDYLQKAAIAGRQILDAVTKGASPIPATKRALELLGLRVVSDVRARIRAGIPPPLKPATIEAKGSSIPLIDTGQLIQAITHRVEIK